MDQKGSSSKSIADKITCEKTGFCSECDAGNNLQEDGFIMLDKPDDTSSIEKDGWLIVPVDTPEEQKDTRMPCEKSSSKVTNSQNKATASTEHGFIMLDKPDDTSSIGKDEWEIVPDTPEEQKKYNKMLREESNSKGTNSQKKASATSTKLPQHGFIMLDKPDDTSSIGKDEREIIPDTPEEQKKYTKMLREESNSKGTNSQKKASTTRTKLQEDGFTILHEPDDTESTVKEGWQIVSAVDAPEEKPDAKIPRQESNSRGTNTQMEAAATDTEPQKNGSIRMNPNAVYWKR